MRALLIQYIVLYSKMGYTQPASLIASYLRDGLPSPEFQWHMLERIQETLAYEGAPAWLYESLMWHIAELHEKMHAGQ